MGKEVNLIPKIDQDDFKFEKLIEHHGKSVVIFSADWCPYCVSFFNNWTEYSDISDVFIADITDVESKLWDVFNINIVPTSGFTYSSVIGLSMLISLIPFTPQVK